MTTPSLCCPACGAVLNDREPAPRIICSGCGAETRVEIHIDQFQLIDVLARNSTSTIYKAADTSLGREVAVELFRGDASDPITLKLLQAQAAVLARTNHPHLIKVYSTGTFNSRFYVVMELMQQGSLHDIVLRSGGMPEADALEMMIQIAKGLHAAYEAGLIHRNLQPQSILYSEEHNTRISSFSLSPSKEIEGLRYAAPEIFEGDPGSLAGDIYALGATFLFAMAGTAPFDVADPTPLKLHHLKIESFNPQQIVPTLSQPLNAILRRMLSRNPLHRFQDYTDLIARLEAIQDGTSAPQTYSARTIAPVTASESALGWQIAAVVSFAFLVGTGWFLRSQLSKVKTEIAAQTPAARVMAELPKPGKIARRSEPAADSDADADSDNKNSADPSKIKFHTVNESELALNRIPVGDRAKIEPGVYQLINRRSGKSLAWDNQKDRITEAEYRDSPTQHWTISGGIDGVYQFRNEASGQLMDVTRIPWVNNAYLKIPDGKQSLTSNWVLTTVPDQNCFRIISETETGSVASNPDKKRASAVEMRVTIKQETSWWDLKPVSVPTAQKPAAVVTSHD